MIRPHYLILLVILSNLSPIIGYSQDQTKSFFGFEYPGEIPQVFAPGVVSTEDFFEFSNAFTSDGTKFHFARRIDQKDVIMVMKFNDNRLVSPEIDTFFQKYSGFEPHFSHDSRLYFTRFAPPPSGLDDTKDLSPRDMEAQMVNIWVSKKEKYGWGEPQFCVNGMYVTTAVNGTLYTSDIREQTEGICRYEIVDDKYSLGEHIALDPDLQSPGTHPCIAPDESFLIFDSKVSQNSNNSDLFITFQLSNNTWSEAFNLGIPINTEGTEMAAALSPDGKYLFYHSNGDIYWVDINIINKFRPK